MIANASIYLDGADSRWIRVTPDIYREAASLTLKALAGLPTVVMLPVPRPGFDVPMCLARAHWRPWLGSDCRFVRQEAETSSSRAPGRRGRASCSSRRSWRCHMPVPVCETVAGGNVVYRDDNHLTPRFAATLAPAMKNALQRVSLKTGPARVTRFRARTIMPRSRTDSQDTMRPDLHRLVRPTTLPSVTLLPL